MDSACGFILFWGIKYIHGLRVDKRIEEEGLDIHEHGEALLNQHSNVINIYLGRRFLCRNRLFLSVCNYNRTNSFNLKYKTDIKHGNLILAICFNIFCKLNLINIKQIANFAVEIISI